MFLYFLKFTGFRVYVFLVCVGALEMREVKQITPKQKKTKGDEKNVNSVERRR